MSPEELAKKLRQERYYDPETGKFWSIIRKKLYGTYRSDGYVVLWWNNRLYLAHRLAWLYTYGEWPKQELDHINQNRSDNRISNLRDVSRSVNNMNGKLHGRNTSGYRGVSFDKSRGKFAAQAGGKLLGRFNTAEEAYEVYRAYAEKNLNLPPL